MQGDQVKALIILSKAKGWDPNVIYGTDDRIDNFNAPTQIYVNQAGTGKLPQGTPDTFPESIYNAKAGADTPVSFSTPDYKQETKVRRTRNANPYEGFDGGY